MNVERAVFRLLDIQQAIGNIHVALAGLTYDQVQADPVRRAAFERFLEIISEASRHVPVEWREAHGQAIPWPNIATIGNILRHVYREVDHRVLWDIYELHLGPLDQAIIAMLEAYDPDRRFRY